MALEPDTESEATAPSVRPRASIDTPAFAALFALVLGFVAFARVEGTGETGLLAFTGFWVLWTVAALLLGLRSSGQGDDGSASAWLVFGLPAILVPLLLSVPAIHPLHLLGQDVCDPSTLFCDAGPAPAGNWVPLIFFVIAIVATFRALRRSRRNARVG